MKFTRSKKLVFFNNKGGVGKTTLAYNAAVEFAEMGYKTVLVDLVCNVTFLWLLLGSFFEDNLFSKKSADNLYRFTGE